MLQQKCPAAAQSRVNTHVHSSSESIPGRLRSLLLVPLVCPPSRSEGSVGSRSRLGSTYPAPCLTSHTPSPPPLTVRDSKWAHSSVLGRRQTVFCGSCCSPCRLPDSLALTPPLHTLCLRTASCTVFIQALPSPQIHHALDPTRFDMRSQ
jgi:hypothetical protein